MKKLFSFFLALVFLSVFLGALSDGEKITVTGEDYQRAEKFLRRNIEKKIFCLNVQPHWIKKGPSFWYRVNTREGKKFVRVDPQMRTRRDAFDHEALARLLSEKTGKDFKPGDLPFDSIEFIEEKSIVFKTEEKNWLLDLETYELTEREEEEEKKEEKDSPDGKWTAFVKSNNLFIRSKEDGREIQLSRSGRRFFEYGTDLGWGDLIKDENGKCPVNISVKWSPDSKKIYTHILDLRQARKMYLLNPVNDGDRSELFSYYRASPGDRNTALIIPVIFDVGTHEEIKIDTDPIPHFLDLRVDWLEEGNKIFAQKFTRGYKIVEICEIDAQTGVMRVCAKDMSETSVETALCRYEVLGKGEKILLTSERDGWNHIYLFNGPTGQLVNQVTKGRFVVLDIVHIDEETQKVTFTAVGREQGQDPYWVHLYRIGLDGSGFQALTPEEGYHEIFESPDKTLFVDNISRVGMPTRSVLRNMENGSVVMNLERADVSEIMTMGWTYPEPFIVKAADGETDIHGLIWKPSHFDPMKKYPVIDQCYTGPQAVNTPKTFGRALLNSALPLAELQFIVVSIDGRGTARRSKKFHDFSYKNLGGGCTDHIPAIKELARRFSYIDANRVGIYGHSAGGYDTVRALLQWPEFFKVGVSSSGNHDHRMAKAWWPEQYMGWPVGDYYKQQSNITHAGKLQGKLLLVHGGMDENVNPASTLRLVDALVRNNKDFDLLILPDSHHGYRGVAGDYFTRKRWDYFVEHLHGQNPPAFRITPEKK
ncbi:MAG: prolyl oligopeptidase family serine peptidase [Candidatus Aminicenantes bacterium]|nr:prolyl oligopeptidase family serine peptidase [Candidatus Aminicenantes bacterium]